MHLEVSEGQALTLLNILTHWLDALEHDSARRAEYEELKQIALGIQKELLHGEHSIAVADRHPPDAQVFRAWLQDFWRRESREVARVSGLRPYSQDEIRLLENIVLDLSVFRQTINQYLAWFRSHDKSC